MKLLRMLTTALLCALLPVTAISQVKKPLSTPKKKAVGLIAAPVKPASTTVGALLSVPVSTTNQLSTTSQPVTSAASQSNAQNTTATVPSTASGLLGNSPLQLLFKRLTSDDTTRKRTPVGNVGVGISLYTSGSVIGGLVIKKTAYYMTLGAGMFANKTQYVPANDLLVYGGAGIPLKNHVKAGAILTVTMLSSSNANYNATIRVFEGTSTHRPALGLGIQASVEVRHLWLTATLHKQLGLSVGATYFF